MNKIEVIQQTKLAFDFIQKLYLEVSYLIKEIEGLLAEEDERFIICRPNGYMVTSRSSSGLEPNYVSLWAPRVFSVCFVPETMTTRKSGQTITKFSSEAQVIYLRIVLDDKESTEPFLDAGVLHDFSSAKLEKIEKLLAHILYNEAKVFTSKNEIDYKDNYVSFRGNLFSRNLYDINSSEDVVKKVINPALKLFRGIQK